MRTFLLLLTLHAACDGPAGAPETTESSSGEAATGPGRAPARGAASRATPPEDRPPPDAAGWNTLLSTYVAEDGFRYEALKGHAEHRDLLARYVGQIGSASDSGWDRAEALAFYVNAYNALTVAAVIEAWPLESVMNVEGFFDTVEHRVAGASMTLNALENDIIRSDRFDDPRIHFAVNCASKSCPPLATEAYTAANLESRMEAAARSYVRATTVVSGRKAEISRLFEWFAEDFGGADGVRTFVAGRLEGDAAETVRNPRTTLGFHDYDWAINAAVAPQTAQ